MHRKFILLSWPAVLLMICLAPRVMAAEEIRRIPPQGVAVPNGDRAELQAGIEELGKAIDGLRDSLKAKPGLLDLLPDVQIYHNAARYALTYDEFFNVKEIGVAKSLLKQGLDRAAALQKGESPWTTQTGPVARGYVSRIDGSVQPYGIVVPATFAAEPSRPRRLDIWFHGRGETLSEVNFLNDRHRSLGEFAPADALVLHPYGRYCNANRFAGEVDTFEAMEHVRKHYPVDENRVSVRGFSMGGAACWQFATHHAGLWAAAAPGAGFSEAAEFLHIADPETTVPAYQRALWHWYDPADYAVNLFNCPTVAYSGGKDGQKQAADVMAKALAAEGIDLVHVIGPDTGHAYHPEAKKEVARRIDALAAHGRDALPRHVRFTTYTLRYNQMNWITIDALGRHWTKAHVEGEMIDDNQVRLKTENVTALTLEAPPGLCPLDNARKPRVMIDGQELTAAAVGSDRSWSAHFQRVGDSWKPVDAVDGAFHKRHGLQGPIDDAFMDSFIMVRPTGSPMSEAAGKWVDAEMKHAVEHWRRQFRGEARVTDDAHVSDADIASSNLVLWGDPKSNALLGRIAAKLPMQWDERTVKIGAAAQPAADHVAVLIYPNPLNPKKYIVLNSGFTFREFDYLNNARQSAKLPDWAILGTSQPADGHTPGAVTAAGFFNEEWKAAE